MPTRRILLLNLVLSACAGSHGDNTNAAGSSSNAAGNTNPAGSGSTTAAGNPSNAAGNTNPAGSGSGGRGAAGTPAQSCTRKPANHRPTAEMCDHERVPSAEVPQPVSGCTTDAECTEGQNGRCGPNNRGIRTCNYDQCFSDSECKEGGPCICGGVEANNRCFPGDCRTDADCGASGSCSPSFGTCGNYSGVVAYYCHTCKDECIDDRDCRDGGYCAYEPTVGHWKCSTSQCVG
jgi:hypothetical protein